jgi:hypothetical protein
MQPDTAPAEAGPGMPARPLGIRIAVTLLLVNAVAGIALTGIAGVMNISTRFHPSPPVELVGLASAIGLPIAIWTGRGWARVTYTIVAVLGMPFILMVTILWVVHPATAPTAPGWISLYLGVVLTATAVAFMWKKESSAYFASRFTDPARTEPVQTEPLTDCSHNPPCWPGLGCRRN